MVWGLWWRCRGGSYTSGVCFPVCSSCWGRCPPRSLFPFLWSSSCTAPCLPRASIDAHTHTHAETELRLQHLFHYRVQVPYVRATAVRERARKDIYFSSEIGERERRWILPGPCAIRAGDCCARKSTQGHILLFRNWREGEKMDIAGKSWLS